MRDYPSTTAAAQERAAAIARGFTNYQCVECSREIVRALGPQADAAVIKLRVPPQRGDDVVLPSQGRHVSSSGHHVGVRVGDRVYDNHHPDGVPVERWPSLYTDLEYGALLVYEQPVGEFFGRRFRSKSFSSFASSRFQLGED